jgi:hydroxyethylthiazole kinase-like uncharacterized protein yjeF
MRILNIEQIKQLDAYTIAHEPVSSIDLMERASRAFVDWFTPRVDVTRKIGVICGTGNNGGDGLAIARLLFEWGYNVRVWIIPGTGQGSDDFRTNRERLPTKVEVVEVGPAAEVSFDNCDVLIDAIFGSGLSRPPSGLYADVIRLVNESKAMRVAVDIPSGLLADGHSVEPIVRAHYTVTFQLPKLAFLLPETFPYTGEWVVVDIGLDRKFIKESETLYFYSDLNLVRKLRRSRSKFDHKGTYGHALLICGSYGKMGAAVLAARAALRSGLGLLTMHVPRCGYSIMQTSVPEAMCHVDDDEHVFSNPPQLTPYTTIGIGPGLGQDALTKKALARTLEASEKPVVLDADALNILSSDRHLLNLIPAGSILTPHPREFQRLVGTWQNDFQRLEMQKQLAVSLRVNIVLKGAHTSVATDKGLVYFNSTGNPGMATGGTGDVLTGVLTALLAQQYSPVDAAVIGVFLHGMAGDFAAKTFGMESMTASDLVDNLAPAFLKFSVK